MPYSVLDDLTRINTEDMLAAFGLAALPARPLRNLAACACYLPARRFARTVLEFDRRVAAEGLQPAAAWGLATFAAGVTIHGLAGLPPQGGVLLAANHPGIADTLALFATLPRADLLTVAAARPFLHALAHTSQRLITVDETAAAPLRPIRRVAAHLRRGGAVLTFPGGRIEPDPAVLHGACAAFDAWTGSLGLFARLAPAAHIVPVLVSGVFSPRALHSPLTRLRRTAAGRQRFAAMLQVAAPRRYPVQITVALAPPLAAADLLAAGGDAAVKPAVIASMRALLAASPARLLP
jgi:1-acyl-sn-glycerol-3-phosphate acyltransferase